MQKKVQERKGLVTGWQKRRDNKEEARGAVEVYRSINHSQERGSGRKINQRTKKRYKQFKIESNRGILKLKQSSAKGLLALRSLSVRAPKGIEALSLLRFPLLTCWTLIDIRHYKTTSSEQMLCLA